MLQTISSRELAEIAVQATADYHQLAPEHNLLVLCRKVPSTRTAKEPLLIRPTLEQAMTIKGAAIKVVGIGGGVTRQCLVLDVE